MDRVRTIFHFLPVRIFITLPPLLVGSIQCGLIQVDFLRVRVGIEVRILNVLFNEERECFLKLMLGMYNIQV